MTGQSVLSLKRSRNSKMSLNTGSLEPTACLRFSVLSHYELGCLCYTSSDSVKLAYPSAHCKEETFSSTCVPVGASSHTLQLNHWKCS